MRPTIAAPPGRFVHPALFYRSDEEYLAGLIPFVLDGLAEQQPVAIAVPGTRLQLLRRSLAGAAEQVTMIDMLEAGRNPGRIIASVLRRFADAHPGRHVRIVGEPIWLGRTEKEYPACAQHEALINVAFADRDVTIVCPYDTARLSRQVIADARATHPLLWERGRKGPSEHYDPDGIFAEYNHPLADATQERSADPGLYVAVPTDLPSVRRRVVETARRHGLARHRLSDLALIVDELVGNSLVHTASGCLLRVWADAGHLVCQVRDKGRLTDPLAGRRPTRPGQLGGRGLLIVNDLADLVRVHSGADGTTIRALLRLPA